MINILDVHLKPYEKIQKTLKKSPLGTMIVEKQIMFKDHYLGLLAQ